jgi:phenylacetate-CoA ligase
LDKAVCAILNFVEARISSARADRLDEERLAQRSWPLKQPAIAPLIEALLRREFLEPQSASDVEALELQRIISFAKSEVPYYRDSEVWRAFSIRRPVSRELLATLPVLGKTQLRDNFDALNARRLPIGERFCYETKSSGTTGAPTRVRFGQQAAMAFGLLAQRLHRWARFDARLSQAVIRIARDLHKEKDGSLLPDRKIQRSEGWMYVRNFFHTGPQVAIARSNSVEFQLEFLRAERPAYLMTLPDSLETLVYAAQGKPVDSLQGLRCIAATLTDAMRRQIEAATRLTVQQPFGLNEIGAVASRCPAGRYHVNAEHCVVEVVDEHNQPCKPGEFGRLLVTALTNVVMPLIRYDTGDIAEAVSGECACGRTLPAFGRVRGRYRASGHAPEGTMRRMDLVLELLRALPLDMLTNLREYQLHQYRDGRFELRLNTRGEPNARLLAALREAWDTEAGTATLDIIRVDEIAATPGGKAQDFTSDFFPSIHDGA